jgi:hypothetical protein
VIFHHPYKSNFLQVLVATFSHSVRAQLQLNVARTADRAGAGGQDTASQIQVASGQDTASQIQVANGQDTASQIQVANAHANRAIGCRYLDPLDWNKYYMQYTNAAGIADFIKLKCPQNSVFNPGTGQCTSRLSNVNNPPILPHIEGDTCNGLQGYYCNENAFTYCTADKLKIVENQSCPGSFKCNAGKTNPCSE